MIQSYKKKSARQSAKQIFMWIFLDTYIYDALRWMWTIPSLLCGQRRLWQPPRCDAWRE